MSAGETDLAGDDFQEAWPDRNRRLGREAALERLRDLAQTLDNPVYVWRAIALCNLAGHPALPLPEWCMQYLVSAACRIQTLSELFDPDDYPFRNKDEDAAVYAQRVAAWKSQSSPLDARAARGKILAALGFERKAHLLQTFRDDRAAQLAILQTLPKNMVPNSARRPSTGTEGERKAWDRQLKRGRKILAPKQTDKK